MWELRVEGRLLEDYGAGNQAQGSKTETKLAPQSQAQKRKFSSFFKSLVIELDKDIYGPDNHLVEVTLCMNELILNTILKFRCWALFSGTVLRRPARQTGSK